MTIANRNTLRGAFDAAHKAANIAADIRLTFDIWSTRYPLVIAEESQKDVRFLFDQVHLLLRQAEQCLDEALAAQPGVQHARLGERAQRQPAEGRA